MLCHTLIPLMYQSLQTTILSMMPLINHHPRLCIYNVLDIHLISYQFKRMLNIVVKKMTIDVLATLDEVRCKLMKTNAKYNEVVNRHYRTKVLKERDRVIVFLCKEIFLVRLHSKLHHKKYSPYTKIKNVNNNAFIIDLLDNMSISIIIIF